ncbi:olfactory receptor 2J2-like [Protobothrops mucrosquamatus]|uniref:olfactory receptor 2J2-like n=1 Tax=Protobothrops mucrosquamatus TaxID=103944 RepID=UPI0007756A3B|nr:olfactory receptor 2J2-like [Protobothrops mucrosquamatus]
MGAENYTTTREFILLGLTSHPKNRLLLFVTVLLIYLLTIFGNTLIIILVWADSQLHTPMYFFLGHLASMEIGYVTSTLPQMLTHLLTGNGVISLVCCTLQGYMTLAMGSTECLLLGAMAYDRYLAICHPLVYTLAMDRYHQLLLATSCWTIGFVFSAIYVLCTFRHPFCGIVINHFICEPPAVLKLACGDTRITKVIGFGLSSFIVLIPLFVILTSYGYILDSVLHMRSTGGWHKAFSTCGSHLAVVTLFYGTIISMYIVPQSSSSPDRDKKIAVFYLVITPLLNPIIYTLRNKDIHLAALKMLKRL